MRDLIGTSRRELEYFNLYKFQSSLIRSARMHGYVGFWNVFCYGIIKFKDYVLGRIAYFAPYNGIRVWCHKKRGVIIGKNVEIGFHCMLDEIFPDFITIESDVSLAGNVYILTHSNPYEYYKNEVDSFVAPVVIKKNAWITINVTILPDVTIGEGSIVAAGSVVTKDVSDHVLVGGNPAEVIKELNKQQL